MTSRNRQLTCCVCGSDAGIFKQHWNRDTGYGICPRCAAEEAGRDTPEEFKMRYGEPGVNFEQPTVVHMGRRYKLLAKFASNERGTARANAFMEANPGASLLCVTDGAYLADAKDLGEPVSA